MPVSCLCAARRSSLTSWRLIKPERFLNAVSGSVLTLATVAAGAGNSSSESLSIRERAVVVAFSRGVVVKRAGAGSSSESLSTRDLALVPLACVAVFCACEAPVSSSESASTRARAEVAEERPADGRGSRFIVGRCSSSLESTRDRILDVGMAGSCLIDDCTSALTFFCALN